VTEVPDYRCAILFLQGICHKKCLSRCIDFLFPNMVFDIKEYYLPDSKNFFAYRVPILLKRPGARRLDESVVLHQLL
jgi:hypothetical protein